MNDIRSLPRRRRLPPLNLLRTFEASARLLSFTLAADELLITQSAVSQQIRQLEEFLDVRLFRRLPRRLELTREAISFAGAVHEAVELMAQACTKLADPEAPSVLCVNATPAFASRWLSPRLKRFMETYPHIRVTLLSSDDAVDFRRQDIDVAIRWGRGNWPESQSTQLGAGALIPVCSPTLQSGSPPDVNLLHEQVLLQVINHAHWAQWITDRGLPRSRFVESLYFSDAGLMLDAAIEGQGICLVSSLLAQKDIDRGHLIVPFDAPLQTDDCFHLMADITLANKPKIAAFREWILSEINEEELEKVDNAPVNS